MTTDPTPPTAPDARTTPAIPRRRILTGLGAAAAGLVSLRAAGAFGRAGDLGPLGAFGAPGSTGALRPLAARDIRAAATKDRALVVIELSGGNDGLSTLVPHGDPAYRRLRDATAIDAAEVVPVDASFGFHPQLAPCASRLAALHGVGSARPNGSHFEMSARWWAGDENGDRHLATGFLGRLCDELDDGAAVTGVSLAGVTPALLSAKAVTIGLPALDRLAWLREDDAWARHLRDGMARLAAAPAPAAGDPAARATAAATAGIGRALGFGTLLGGPAFAGDEAKDANAVTYPGSSLGAQLQLGAALLAAGAGVRVVHTSIGGFDTHSGQRGAHDERMRELAEALAAFGTDLDRRGLAGSVLVATTSEFGRRAKENGSGTDHGTASCALLMGPVRAGLHGEPPSLTQLDADDNLRATASFEAYYATLAETWFDVDAKTVLSAGVRPVDGIIAT